MAARIPSIPVDISRELKDRFVVKDNTFKRVVKNARKDRITLLIELGREAEVFHRFANFSSSFWRLVTPVGKTNFSSMLWAILRSKSRFMYFHMIGFFNNLQIFWSIIAFNTINMMHQLVVFEFPAYGFFGYQNRVEDIARLIRSMMTRIPNPEISTIPSSSLKVGAFLSLFKFRTRRKVFTFFDLPSSMSTNHGSVFANIRAILFGPKPAWGDSKSFITGLAVYKNHNAIIAK